MMNDEGRRHSAPATCSDPRTEEDSRTSGGSAPPALVVTFELERRPVVFSTAQTESDSQRLLTWLDSRGVYRRLVAEAIELAQEAA